MDKEDKQPPQASGKAIKKFMETYENYLKEDLQGEITS